MRLKLIFICFATAFSQTLTKTQSFLEKEKPKPNIGILAGDFLAFKNSKDEGIPVTYTRLVEMSGAVPVIMPVKQGMAKVLEILHQVNGVLLPGGGNLPQKKDGSPSEYYLIVQQILHYQEEQMQKGISFPVFGICQGLQFLAMVTAINPSVLERASKVNERSVLGFHGLDPITSRYYREFDQNHLQTMMTQPLAFHIHEMGVTRQNFEANNALNAKFRVLTWEHYSGKDVVSSIEARHLPIFATLFHPEIIFSPCDAYDIIVCEANKSYAQSFSDALFREAVKNQFQFESQKQLEALKVTNQKFLSYEYTFKVHPIEGSASFTCTRSEYYF